MEQLAVTKIASWFDEIGEEWLEPFDWNPNTGLPHGQQRVYRIKDLFLATYRRKICRFTVEEEDDCKVKFHMIFADNRFRALQLKDELKKLELMATGAKYDRYMVARRQNDNRVVTAENMNNTSTSEGTTTNKGGELGGTVDAIQLGTVLTEDKRVINTNKLPDYFDENIRNYNQGVSVGSSSDTSKGTSNSTANTETTSRTNNTANLMQGSEAINQIKAHTVKLRRIREEFVQCFNVLFY